jgi:two-component system sensor histidine kinase DegS
LATPKKPVSIPTGTSATPQQLGEEARAELDQTQKEIKEIDLLLQQTSAEVDRLAQRNAQAASNLKQLEASLDTVPRADLQTAYTTALDAQKRLFMMRGQLEKLQSDQHNVGRYVSYLRKVADSLQQQPDRSSPAVSTNAPDNDTANQASICMMARLNL